MKKIRVSAKSVEKAIAEGLKELNATQDEVDIKIIDGGGLLKKAVVELTLDKEIEEIRKAEEKVVSKDSEAEKKAEVLENKNKTSIEEPSKETKKENKEDQKDVNWDAKNSKIKVEKNYEECSNIISGKNAIEFGTKFLKELFNRMSVEAEITAVELENGITFNASGEKVSTLIGKRGETLNAIQDILSNVLRNNGYRDTRFYFDVENYKNRREVSLVSLAERMANKCVKINKPIKLERMNAYERKIIHSALQNFEGVTTHSEGEEPNRYLVIIPSSSSEEENN